METSKTGFLEDEESGARRKCHGPYRGHQPRFLHACGLAHRGMRNSEGGLGTSFGYSQDSSKPVSGQAGTCSTCNTRIVRRILASRKSILSPPRCLMSWKLAVFVLSSVDVILEPAMALGNQGHSA
jgi:hypothetical protein